MNGRRLVLESFGPCDVVLNDTMVSILIPGSWGGFSCSGGSPAKLLRLGWKFEVVNSQPIKKTSRGVDSPILIIFIQFVEKCTVPLLGKHTTLAYIFGSWTRRKRYLLLRWKVLLFSTQQKCAGNSRNKSSRLSASFCTKNHRNPFTSLRERVDWRCHASSKKVLKLKTRVLVM